MQKSKWYPWFVVGILWFIALLNYLDRQMLSTMQPFMKASIGELNSATNFGRLMAIFLWVYAFMSPLSGMIADRLNRKWLIIGSLFVWSGVTWAMGYARTFEQLYALRALMGISEAFYIPAALALIADYHDAGTRSFAIGIHTTGVYLGQALGGFGAVIAAVSSWQFTFQSFGFVGIAYSIFLLFFLKEKKGYTVDATKSVSLKMELSGAVRGVGMLLGNLSFWIILFYFSAPSLPGWATKSWLPTLFSRTLNLPMEEAGPFSTMTLALASLAGVLAGGALSDAWVRRNLKGRIYTGAIGLALTIPALFLLGFGSTVIPVFAGALCFGLGFGMFDVNNMPILCQFVSPRYRATGYGLMNMAGISAGAFITNFLGKSIDSGHLGRDFAILTTLIVITLILQLTLLKPRTANMEAPGPSPLP
ncbi:MAG: MFS transporter [Tannerellaceae bacterium]|jgi:MFS family permease|nr:MFS transporter [Tannerellaceae bacterium]